jgi:DnaJ-domain-containing protein 1
MSFDQADNDLGPLEDDDEPLFGNRTRWEEDEAEERDEADSYYAVLNVSKGATADEISKRYKALAGKKLCSL